MSKYITILSKYKFLLPAITPIVIFIIAIMTLSHYGMNYDSPVHFARGQAFLRYFLTGKTNYNGLTPFCRGKDNYSAPVDYKTHETCDKHRKNRVSEFQSTILDFNYFKGDIYGHPPLTDIFLAVTNNIFFINLGWLEDVESYQLFSIIAALLLMLVVSYWSYITYGLFASIISVLIISLFPLFFGEQHFNIKDIPMAAFFTSAIFFFWLGIVKNKPLYIFLFAVFAGCSFATKFNVLFAPFILLPWFIFYLKKLYSEKVLKKSKSSLTAIKKSIALSNKKILFLMLISPVIIFAIFYFSWPVLWSDPFNNVALVFKFYRDIGTSQCSYSFFSFDWFRNCFNYIPIQYFIYTLPVVSIVYFLVGFIIGLRQYRRNNFVTVLWITFFIATIGRVTVPGSSIYGGLRQIMEFIAPTALLGGVGASYIRDKITIAFTRSKSKYNKRKVGTMILSILLVLLFIPTMNKLIQLHPNENVYYNFLIGGIEGAYKKNFYGYGNTYGNAYYQGIQWMNKYSVPNARLTLLWGLNQNISRGSTREDVTHLGIERSGFTQLGEYQLTTLEQGNPVYSTFRYKYADEFLNPVYILKAENIPLLKIWKNDKEHTRKGIDINSEELIDATMSDLGDKIYDFSFDKSYFLKRMEMRFSDKKCKIPFVGTAFFVSTDKNSYQRMGDEVNDFTESELKNYNADFAYLFAGDKAESVRLILPQKYPCSINDIKFQFYVFKNLYMK